MRQDFTYAMVCYNTKHSTSEATLEKESAEPKVKDGEQQKQLVSQSVYWDLTIYLVFDHRANNNLEKIAEKLIEDVIKEQESIFFKL